MGFLFRIRIGRYDMVAMKRSVVAGLALLILSLLVVGVSAYVYETANISITQTIKNIATLTVQNSALGNIEEGQTIGYAKSNMSTLGSIFNLTTTKAGVVLHLDSNVDLLSSYYSTYTITVKYAVALSGHNVGDVAKTITLASPDPTALTLEIAGDWRFDFEITTTAKSVSADQATTVTIIVTAEST
jgi:hypothetical protein